MVEAIERVGVRPTSTGWTNCLRVSVARCRRSRAHRLRAPAPRPPACANSSPITDSGLDRGALGAAELVQPRLEQRVDRRRHRRSRPCLGHAPSARRPRRSAPLSISIDSSCSTYSGLPSAASTMRSNTSCGMPVAPSRLATTCAAAASLSGRSTMRDAPRLLAPLRLLLEQVVARGGQQQDRRAAGASTHVLQQVEERRLGPVDVVDQRDDRAVGGQRSRGTCAPPSRARAAGRSPCSARSPPPRDRRRPRSPTWPAAWPAPLGLVVVADVGRARRPSRAAART